MLARWILTANALEVMAHLIVVDALLSRNHCILHLYWVFNCLWQNESLYPTHHSSITQAQVDKTYLCFITQISLNITWVRQYSFDGLPDCLPNPAIKDFVFFLSILLYHMDKMLSIITYRAFLQIDCLSVFLLPF